KKSNADRINRRKAIGDDPTIKVKLEKSTPLNKAPISGIIISSTNEETIFPNAAPIITATAKSNTFPSKANFLKSSHIFFTSHIISLYLVKTVHSTLNYYYQNHSKLFAFTSSKPL